ncbi:glycosyltransferase family 39 protein [Persicobacter sp. CCB-QB2]|uniref:glycosyltransferase family 39 protein n=1 Tax=Persicobacter sp. CCB-QB2 TaxID=1561025 RepID=UPI0006A9A65C|nr:glycosyltransferase family 39 protein [Persicobacter sp. CCB-QB2]
MLTSSLSKIQSTKTSALADHLILGFIILLKFILQYFAINPVYELHRDEYLHIDLGNHLAWGYASVPPITGLISKVILSLGGAVFWVKFFPALFGAGLLYFVWKMVEELDGGLFAKVLATSSVMFSVLVRINTLYQPNSLDFLCWTALFYFVIKYVNRGEIQWLYAIGLVFGIGFLNKYNIVFLVIGIIPAIALSPHRKLFKNAHLYKAVGLAVILISPNLYWQWINDFPVIKHMTALTEIQLVKVSRWDFLKEQLYFFFGSLPVLVTGIGALLVNRKYKRYQFLAFALIFILVLFTYLRAKGYYAIGLYPVFLAFGAVVLEQYLKNSWKKFIGLVLLVFPIGFFVFMMPIFLPVWSPEKMEEEQEMFNDLGLNRWEDGKLHAIPQDYADMLGWKELAGIVDQGIGQLASKDHLLIHCDNYGQAGAINYYSNSGVPALSLNADYINWYDLEKEPIINVVLVNNAGNFDRDREENLFSEVIKIGEIQHPLAREKGTTVYLLKGAKRSINDILKSEIAQRKSIE